MLVVITVITIIAIIDVIAVTTVIADVFMIVKNELKLVFVLDLKKQ